MRSIDETGNEYGTLLVQCKLPPRNGKTHWRCLCDVCGKTSDIAGSDLRSGKMGTCACQHDKREYPNVLGLQKRLDALEATLAAVQVQVAELIAVPRAALGAAPAEPQPPIDEPAVAFKGPKAVQGPVARLEEIFAIPFEQRTDMKALQDEIRDLMQAESKAVTEAKMADGGIRAYDRDLANRSTALVKYSQLLAKFHLHPRDL